MYEENLEELKQKTGSKVFKHYMNFNSPILPFRVDYMDQTQFENGFDGIIGDFSRILSNKKIPDEFNIEDILQNVLLNNDFLYLIKGLCVKEEKIKLNDLFKEYGLSGLFFDRYSKEEIVNLLNTWNLIYKKSDSGDAQYVKSIL